MRWVAPASWLLLVISAPLLAQQATPTVDPDLARIPSVLQATPSTDSSSAGNTGDSATFRIDLDSALTASTPQISMPGPTPSGSWAALSSLDGVYQQRLPDNFSMNFSGRLNLEGEAYQGGDWTHAVGFDLREGYISWSSPSQLYVDVGRINVRNGGALGFNPTDYFKTNTLLDQASADPSTIRNDRLGTAMARVQQLWTGGSLTLVLAPKLEDPAPITDAFHSGFGLLLDRTNAANRMLLTGTYEIGGLSPQLLIYHEGDETKYGLNLSHTIGNNVVAYAEWSGTSEPGLIERALLYGELTGTLPASFSNLVGESQQTHFTSDAAVGATWAGAKQWTVNLEYQIHQSGLSGNQLQQWLGLANAMPATYGALFQYARAFAAIQQEPLVQRQYFVRVDCQDAFVRKLELSAFAFVDAYDGSGFTQFSASYHLSNHWTLATLLSDSWGGRYSEYESPTALTARRSLTFEVTRYF